MIECLINDQQSSIEMMWKRRDYPTPNNAGDLKYQVCFTPENKEIYSKFTIQYYKSAHPHLSILIHLNNQEAHDKLECALKGKYELLTWKQASSPSYISFNLNTLGIEEGETVFNIINQAEPSSLSLKEFKIAFLDILKLEQSSLSSTQRSIFERPAKSSRSDAEVNMEPRQSKPRLG